MPMSIPKKAKVWSTAEMTAEIAKQIETGKARVVVVPPELKAVIDETRKKIKAAMKEKEAAA